MAEALVYLLLKPLAGVVILMATVFGIGGVVAIALIPAKGWAGKAQWVGWISGLSLAFVGFVMAIGMSSSGLYILLAALVLLALCVIIQVEHPRLRAVPFSLLLASFTSLVVAVPFVDTIADMLGYAGSVNAIGHLLTVSYGGPFSKAPVVIGQEFGWAMGMALVVGAMPYAVVAGLVGLVVGQLASGKMAPGALALAGAIAATGAGSLIGGFLFDITAYWWSLLPGLAVASLGAAAISFFIPGRSSQGQVEFGNIENQVLRYLEGHHYRVSLSLMADELGIPSEELKGILGVLQKKGHVQL